MATNKERIEALEAGLGGVQDGMQQLEDTEEDRLVAWELFEEELWAHFGPTKCEDFDEALTKVRQIGSLSDYQKEFERLAQNLEGATSLARMKDKQLQCQRRISQPPLPIRTPLALPTTSKASHVKRLSWEEMQRRRAKGLCFNYDDKFTSAHRCKGPQILLLEGSIDDDSEGDIKEAKTDIPSDPEISLHALTGWTTAITKIGTHDIVVFIDSGSTHNFISDKVAALLHLLVVPTAPFHVRVANDQPLKCQGRFHNIHILLQGIPFSITFYSLPLTSLDLVLGVQWLEQLGSVVCDWKRMTMEFQWANKPRLLQGSNTRILQQASLEAISKDMRHTSSIFAICLQPLDASYQTIQLDMQTLIEAFTAIFEKPQPLPPVWEIDHCIPLKKGTNPINVRPYRYAYFQKAEIEKQVLDMLKLRVIRPSTSPFSFLVLLVKKKNDTWRFCTDYRALNSVTIKDRFPIPTVNDMLDELHGASYFTKLDLRAGHHQAMLDWPCPTNVLELHGFLGLIGYYRKFVRNYGILARSPTNLLKKGQFGWTAKAETSFKLLQQAMTTTPTLTMPNF
ncbi:putative mitochondrial protein [Vitis vinifera]|uniref:Putative mitochondrial protein n=1 Tax=Vitis vinifera TaxID=29760 RepID=A0A438KA65_VITVI|nr:putative mitochondrial protein [Vitis vinifera]